MWIHIVKWHSAGSYNNKTTLSKITVGTRTNKPAYYN